MAKQKGNTQQSKNQYSLQDCEWRLVTEKDKWCKISRPKSGDNNPAPNGYVVLVPTIPNKNTVLENVGGIIIRSKKHCGQLMLQVVQKRNELYGIASFARHEPNASKRKRKNKKKLYRVLNIQNMNKHTDDRQYKW